MKSRTLHLLCFFIASLFFPLYGQMPDWYYFKDGDGNIYYYDRNGSIWTSGSPDFEYKTITASGMDYYIRQSELLLKGHYPVEGLVLIKSIMVMPPVDQRIIDAQKRASELLNAMKRREGTRFSGYDELAVPLLYRLENETCMVNDVMRYALKVRGGISILTNKRRKNTWYRYNGILMGIRMDSGKNQGADKKYDFLVAVDAQEFAVPVKKIEDLEESFKYKPGFEAVSRTELLREDKKIINSYAGTGDNTLGGYEGIIINGTFGYVIRTIAPVGSGPELNDEMKNTVMNFTFSGR